MPEIVNAVGGGELNVSVKLEEWINHPEFEFVSYEPEVHAALVIRISENDPTVMLYSTGKYNIAGADSVESLKKTSDRISEVILKECDEDSINTDFEVRYLTFIDKYKCELDLGMLSNAFPSDKVKYQPESNPGLWYRPESNNNVFTIHRNGKILLTGVKNTGKSSKLYNELFEYLDDLFDER